MTDKKWFKIGEAAALVGVSTKELRYWESVIPEIKPRRSKGNLRYYHLDEIPRLQRIRGWLREGLTVADCRALLEQGALTPPPDLAPSGPAVPFLPTPDSTAPEAHLEPLRQALHTLLGKLSTPPPEAQPAAPPKPAKLRTRKPLPPPPGTPPLPLDED